MQQCYLTLVIPVGKEHNIFPWGVHFIAEYLQAKNLVRDVQILNLSDDSDMKKLLGCYEDDLQYLMSHLHSKARAVFRYDQPYYGLVASLGSRFIEIANANNMFSCFRNPLRIRHIGNKLNELKDRYDRLILTKLETLRKEENCRHIFGISTYDNAVFNALYLAKFVRQVIKPNMLIFGGDYWDFKTAWTFTKDSDLADGVVVGYGEKVLEEIIEAVSENPELPDVRQLNIMGLINKRTIAVEKPREDVFVQKKEIKAFEASSQTSQQMFSVPDVYRDGNCVPFRLAYRDSTESKTIHVMTQRGCSYGACQFCTQLDKHLFFQFPVDRVISQLRDLFNEMSPGEKTEILFDNDEITEASLEVLINFFTNYKDKIKTINMMFQVKMASPTIIRALQKAGNASQYFFLMNWESLNPTTLKHMGKGHTPLQAISATKAFADINASFRSNYMIWFPMQDKMSKEKELYFLRAASHLAQGKLNLLIYNANNRDNIYRNADAFRISIRPLVKDIWNKEVFNLNLAYSFWMYDWRTRWSGTMDSFVSRVFEATLARIGTLFFPMFLLLTVFTSRVVGWGVFHAVTRLFIKYRKQVKDGAIQDVCSLTDKTLTRKWTAKEGKKLDISVELNEQAITLLRCAYWPITEDLLFKAVSERGPNSGIKPTLDELEKWGAIIRYGDKLVSVVNDLGYWETGIGDEVAVSVS